MSGASIPPPAVQLSRFWRRASIACLQSVVRTFVHVCACARRGGGGGLHRKFEEEKEEAALDEGIPFVWICVPDYISNIFAALSALIFNTTMTHMEVIRSNLATSLC